MKSTATNFKNQLTAILIVFGFLLLSGCSSDQNINPTQSLTSNLQQGGWIVTTFSKNDNDRLYLLGGYKFTFGNGSVSAVKGNASAIGTWSVGSNLGKTILLLDFNSSSDFSQLTQSWQVVSQSQSKIQLQFTSSNGNDYLTFEAR